MTSKCVAVFAGAFLCFGVLANAAYQSGAVTWNSSESLPVGLYLRIESPVKQGSIVRVAPLWPGDVYRLKYVLGDQSTVSVSNGRIYAFGREWGSVSQEYKQRQPDPIFTGPGVFIYSPHPRSTDSRYYGLIPASYILGVYAPLLVDRRPFNVAQIP